MRSQFLQTAIFPLFNGIISGDQAMRTGLSNLAIETWIPIVFNQIAPKEADGKPNHLAGNY